MKPLLVLLAAGLVLAGCAPRYHEGDYGPAPQTSTPPPPPPAPGPGAAMP